MPTKRTPRAAKVSKPRTVIEATVHRFDGSGSQSVAWPRFSQLAGVEWFRSWVYIAANIVSSECARVPLRLYVRSRPGRAKNFATRPVRGLRKAYLTGQADRRPSASVLGKVAWMGEDFEEVVEPHPAIEVLNRANDFANGYDLTMLRFTFLQLTGNSYLVPVTDDALGVPREVWLLPSQWVQVKPSRTEFIESFVYGPDSANPVTFKREEVIHFKLPNPSDPYYGRGRVESIWSALELHRAKRETDVATFQNRGRPDWLAIVKNSRNQDQLDRFTADMERRLQGQRKTGRFAAVGGDVDIRQLNFPPDIIGDPDRLLDEIAGGFGVPRAMLTGNTNVPGGGSEQADVGFMRGTVSPLLLLDEQQLNAKWLPLFDIGDDAVLAYDDPVPANRAYELDRRVKLVGGGIMTPNEARMDEGLLAVDDVMAESLLFSGRPLGAQAEPQFALNMPSGAEAPPERAPEAPKDIETTTETVLNGAQVTAATAIVIAVASGEIPRDAGIGQLEVLFNLSNEQAERIMGSAGTNKPTTPNPKPPGEQPEAAPAPDPVAAAVEEMNKSMREMFRKALDDALAQLTPIPPAGVTVPMDPGPVLCDESGCVSQTTVVHVDGVTCPPECPCAECAQPVQEPPPAEPPKLNPLEEFMALAWSEGVETKADASDNEREGEPVSVGVKLKRAVAGVLARAETRIIAILNPGVKRIDAADLTKIEDEIRVMGEGIVAEAEPIIRRIVAIGGQRAISGLVPAIEQAGLDVPRFDAANPAVSDAARRFTERLAGEVSDHTTRLMRESIARGIELGDGPADLARRVQDTGAFSPARAETIARTESARAYGEGALRGWEESGIVEGKRFVLSVGACPQCEAFAAEVGDKVFGLREPFAAKGSSVAGLTFDYADVQSGEVHPSCRCFMESVIVNPEG